MYLDENGNKPHNSFQLCVRMVEKYEAIFSCVSPERVPKGSVRTHWKRSRKWPFCVSGVERRHRQFSAATLHADMLDKPALNGRGFARCSNRLLQRNRFLPIDLATSRRNLHLISERLFHTANAVKVK